MNLSQRQTAREVKMKSGRWDIRVSARKGRGRLRVGETKDEETARSLLRTSSFPEDAPAIQDEMRECWSANQKQPQRTHAGFARKNEGGHKKFLNQTWSTSCEDGTRNDEAYLAKKERNHSILSIMVNSYGFSSLRVRYIVIIRHPGAFQGWFRHWREAWRVVHDTVKRVSNGWHRDSNVVLSHSFWKDIVDFSQHSRN